MATIPTTEFVKGDVHPNGVAVLTLDRPNALNALTVDMMVRYKSYIDAWENDPRVKCVVVQSSSPRAFSAGADLKPVLKESTLSYPIKLFGTGYTLLCKISEYKKPYVSLMDGITMGFGLGISSHGHYRVVTERTVIAMPENNVGLFPDVGFSYIAATTPGGGSTGLYLGMTGKRVKNPGDALYLGLGTHYVPSGDLNSLKEALLAAKFCDLDPHQQVGTVLTKFRYQLESKTQLKTLLPQISSTFRADKSVTEIVEGLKKHEKSSNTLVTEWAKESLASIAKGAPFSLCLTHKHYAKVASSARANPKSYDNHLSKFKGVMKIEFRIALRCIMRGDFGEGVVAVLVNKTQNPRWNPPTLDQVNMKEVESIFGPILGVQDLFDSPLTGKTLKFHNPSL